MPSGFGPNKVSVLFLILKSAIKPRKDPSMLVLSRRPGERINIGDGIVITLVSIQGNRIRIGIEAPKAISVRRHELDESTNDAARCQTLSARHPR
jgi:carbon storage regulator